LAPVWEWKLKKNIAEYLNIATSDKQKQRMFFYLLYVIDKQRT